MINSPDDPGYRPPAAGKPDDDDDDDLSDDEENSCTAAVSKATTSLSTWYVIYLMNISPCAACHVLSIVHGNYVVKLWVGRK